MTTDQNALRHTLDQLQRQLDDADDIDEDVVVRLQSTIAETVSALDDSETPTAEHGTNLDRLADAARHFEESHPTLSGTLGRLIDVLGQMGI